jgi:hypothetical protein
MLEQRRHDGEHLDEPERLVHVRLSSTPICSQVVRG